MPNALKKSRNLEPERFAGNDGGLLEVHGGSCVRGCGAVAGTLGIDGDDEQVLSGVVDRDVLMRLEEAQLANALRGDAAGGEVGNRTGLEL